MRLYLRKHRQDPRKVMLRNFANWLQMKILMERQNKIQLEDLKVFCNILKHFINHKKLIEMYHRSTEIILLSIIDCQVYLQLCLEPLGCEIPYTKHRDFLLKKKLMTNWKRIVLSLLSWLILNFILWSSRFLSGSNLAEKLLWGTNTNNSRILRDTQVNLLKDDSKMILRMRSKTSD